MKLGSVLLYVRDVPRSAAFYRDIMGLAVSGVANEEFAFLGDGNIEILLHRDPARLPEHLAMLRLDVKRGQGIVLHFVVADVDQWLAGHAGAAAFVSLGPIDQPFGRRQCYLYDIDGYNIVVEHIFRV